MIKKFTSNYNYIFCIFLAFHWPLINILNINFSELLKFGYISLFQSEIIILFFFFITTFFFLILSKVFKKKLANFFTVIVFSIVIFYLFKPIYSFIGDILTYELNFKSGAYIIFLVLYFSIITIIMSLKNIKKISGILVFVVYILVCQPIVSFTVNILSLNTIQEVNTKNKTVFEGSKIFKNKPNVYIIVPDGYVGPKNYKKLTGDKLDLFINKMSELNFKFISNTRSNYVGSATSIASFFHMYYFRDKFSDKNFPPQTDYFPAVLNAENLPNFLKFFKFNNYKFFMTSNWYVTCQKNNFICLNEGNLFKLSQSANLIFQNTPLKLLFPKLFYLKVDTLTDVIKKIENNFFSTEPSLIFIHYMQPHDPHYFDENCTILSPKELRKKSMIETYNDAIKCVNKNLIKFAQSLNKFDPNAVSIVMSDHGSGYVAHKQKLKLSKSATALDERTDTITFIRTPENCDKFKNNKMGPINVSRFLISCLTNKKIGYLDEKIFVPGDNYDENNSIIESDLLKKY